MQPSLYLFNVRLPLRQRRMEARLLMPAVVNGLELPVPVLLYEAEACDLRQYHPQRFKNLSSYTALQKQSKPEQPTATWVLESRETQRHYAVWSYFCAPLFQGVIRNANINFFFIVINICFDFPISTVLQWQVIPLLIIGVHLIGFLYSWHTKVINKTCFLDNNS